MVLPVRVLTKICMAPVEPQGCAQAHDAAGVSGRTVACPSHTRTGRGRSQRWRDLGSRAPRMARQPFAPTLGLHALAEDSQTDASICEGVPLHRRGRASGRSRSCFGARKRQRVCAAVFGSLQARVTMPCALSFRANVASTRGLSATAPARTVTLRAPLQIENRVAIRFSRFGRKHAPVYRIIAIDSRKPRQGRPLQWLGFYNPISKEVNLDAPNIKKWIATGAQPSEAVTKLLKRAMVIEA